VRKGRNKARSRNGQKKKEDSRSSNQQKKYLSHIKCSNCNKQGHYASPALRRRRDGVSSNNKNKLQQVQKLQVWMR
jgi:hypothetical protein